MDFYRKGGYFGNFMYDKVMQSAGFHFYNYFMITIVTILCNRYTLTYN